MRVTTSLRQCTFAASASLFALAPAAAPAQFVDLGFPFPGTPLPAFATLDGTTYTLGTPAQPYRAEDPELTLELYAVIDTAHPSISYSLKLVDLGAPSGGPFGITVHLKTPISLPPDTAYAHAAYAGTLLTAGDASLTMTGHQSSFLGVPLSGPIEDLKVSMGTTFVPDGPGRYVYSGPPTVGPVPLPSVGGPEWDFFETFVGHILLQGNGDTLILTGSTWLTPIPEPSAVAAGGLLLATGLRRRRTAGNRNGGAVYSR